MGNKIKMIGIGDDGAAGLPSLYEGWIQESEVLVGGERHLAFFPQYAGEKMVIKGGLADLAKQLQAESRRTVILASGDPLFYGIGGYLAGKVELDIYPAHSSVQLAFARMGESWHDALLTSVHGKSIKGLAQRIDGKAKIALLTDDKNNPSVIARYLLDFGMTEYKAFLAENLGGADERTGWYELGELAEAEFSPLNVLILKRVGPSPSWPLGIADSEFAQRKPDKGLITKREIRVLSLAAMQLRETSTVWDIGTCTGSMAIEAARIARQGDVYAIEKNEGDLANCVENARKFRTDLTTRLGRAPVGLDTFADPDAVFIGGSGGELRELLHICCTRLKEGGRIVVNAATIETMGKAMSAFEDEGFKTDITLAQLSRSKPILDLTRFDALNPIFLITAWKQPETLTEEESSND
nr:precorrin-6y C5,15-methyltransferase (decarboxylating) subunit CbiE [Paenibacillus sp. Leaf72]